MKNKLKIILKFFSPAMRLTLGIIFIWACLHKILNPYDFGLQVATYQILPLSLVNLQALILPWLELVSGILIIAGFWTRANALIIFGMNVMFIVAISIALSNDLHLQCGCFASSEVGSELNFELIIRDSVLLLMCLFLFFKSPDFLSLDYFLNKRLNHAK